MMEFPETVDEFMESYKIVDTEQVYTNGAELVPVFRMKQWFEHLPSVQPDIIHCKDCAKADLCAWKREGAKYCSFAERKTDADI